MKKVGMAIFIAVFSFALYPGVVQSAENWALGCSGAGSGPYVWGGKIAKFLNKHQSAVRISAQASAGFNENVELVSNGQIQLGMQDGSLIIKAYEGRDVFKGHPQERIRVLFTIVVVPYHLVTRKASGIETINDLRGKKVNIGLPAQATREVNEAMLRAADIGLREIKVFEMATGQSFTALQDGVIDASGNVFSLGHGRLLELATSTDIRLISIPDQVLEKFIKAFGGVSNYVIPAKTYKGQDAPVNTFSAFVVVFGRDDMPEAVAYDLTKAFWSNIDELNKDKSFKDLKIGYAHSKEVNVPYHPGAMKYFKEAGLMK
ncbi:MAG: TAXI family TRAP transporter solute-binding subunit [Desulfobacterales bacterium]|nr:TAXI family TRAP transporter solute-binding subunit [Desulfobacterales bacterium]